MPAQQPVEVVTRDRDRLLSELYQEHYRSLVRLAVVLLDRRELAEEVVQEAFIKLHGKLDRVKDQSRIDAYLRSIVMNLARSRMRRRMVARKHPPEPMLDAPGADADIDLRDDQREVVDALRSLPARQRDCLVLRYYQELSEAEIAETLGISKGSVKTHTSRGMAALTKVLEVSV
ncbi:MAG: SigE family RNA polymerase sigma factor [Acidimicrobiia bacterium]|nr:SigE family RNA polymerase sigma factor [Acidimicrobiia bacterium]